MKKEVQTHELVKDLFGTGKRVFVPKITGKASEDMRMPEVSSIEELQGLEKNKWGIPEFSLEQLQGRNDGLHTPEALVDLVLAPGVAFTADCNRLGHGKGYYDCFLTRLQQERTKRGLDPAFVIGLAFDEQMHASVPLSELDVQLDAVVTPTSTFLRPTH